MFRRFVKHTYVLSIIHCHEICVYTVFLPNSSVYGARSSLNGVCRRKFRGKGIKSKTFPQVYVISLSCGVVVRCSRFKPSRNCGGRVPYLFFLRSFFYFFVFCVVVFYKYIPVNNCYLIKCNKQQEKYLASREKIVHRNYG